MKLSISTYGTKRIATEYLINKHAREDSGFLHAERLAYEDAAYMLDTSISEVVRAVSLHKHELDALLQEHLDELTAHTAAYFDRNEDAGLEIGHGS